MKICESQAQGSMNYVWMFLDKMRGNTHHDSVSTLATLASLMYLLKKDALCIQYNADWKNVHPFLQIDANFIYMVDPEMLEKWNANGYETLDFCSTLSAEDPLYDLVTKNLSNLFEKGVSKSVLEIVKDIVSGKITPDHYVAILDGILMNDREISMFGLPSEFSALVQKLLDTDGKTIFNPFSGMMSFASAFEGYSHYAGVEANSQICELAKLRLALLDKLGDASIECRDACSWTSQKYDVIVTNPPFGTMMKMQDSLAQPRREDSSVVALNRFEESTTEDGQMLTIVPQSVLYSEKFTSLRKKLTKKNYLDAVICLPESTLLNTSLPVSIIILRKNRVKGAPIKLIDATQMYSGVRPRKIQVDDIFKAYSEDSDNTLLVSTEDIAEKLFSWDTKYYHDVASETFTEGYDILSLSEILSPVKGEKRFSDTEGRCIRTAGTLPEDWTQYVLNIDDIRVSKLPSICRKLTSPVLLLTIAEKTLRLAYCKASAEKPIFVSPNVLAFTLINPGVHIGYLGMEASKKVIPTTGTNVPNTEQLPLALIKIGFPPFANADCFAHQRSLYEEAKSEKMLSKARELGLQEVIDKMKEDYINEVRSRKHDMMPHLRQLSSAQKNMAYYLDHTDEFSSEELFSSIRKEVNNQAKAIDELSQMLSVFSREAEFGEPEVINIYDYLVNHYFDDKDGLYIVDFMPDNVALSNYGFENTGELYDADNLDGFRFLTHGWYKFNDTTIHIAKDDLKRLFDNIVNNAIQHGFTDSSEAHCLEIQLTVAKENRMFAIYFTNDGKPLPKGMNKLRYGLRGEKAGVTGGTGEGGHIVKSIVEHYGGDYDIFTNSSGETVVGITLPIFRDNEQ